MNFIDFGAAHWQNPQQLVVDGAAAGPCYRNETAKATARIWASMYAQLSTLLRDNTVDYQQLCDGLVARGPPIVMSRAPDHLDEEFGLLGAAYIDDQLVCMFAAHRWHDERCRQPIHVVPYITNRASLNESSNRMEASQKKVK